MLIRRPPGHLHVKVFPGGHTGRRAQGRPSSAGGIILYFLPSILGIPWVPPWIGIAREEDVWSAFVRLLKSNKSNIINEIFPDISLKIFCIWKSISKQKKHPLPIGQEKKKKQRWEDDRDENYSLVCDWASQKEIAKVSHRQLRLTDRLMLN